MNRWTLLQHEVFQDEALKTHYDFLVENGEDCLTWKMLILPVLDGSPVEIKKHRNHRLIWLSRESQLLTKNRGFVKRVDNGTYKWLSNQSDKDNFSLTLSGSKINGIFKKSGCLCQLLSVEK